MQTNECTRQYGLPFYHSTSINKAIKKSSFFHMLSPFLQPSDRRSFVDRDLVVVQDVRLVADRRRILGAVWT